MLLILTSAKGFLKYTVLNEIMSMNLLASGPKSDKHHGFWSPRDSHFEVCTLKISTLCFLIMRISFHSPQTKNGRVQHLNIYCSSVAVGAMSASFLRMLILYTRRTPRPLIQINVTHTQHI